MKMNRWILFAVIVSVAFVTDRLAKHWALHLPPPTPWEKLHFIDFKYYENTGIAFGMFEGMGRLFVPAAGLALLFLTFCYNSVPKEDKVSLIALCLIVGGALGNLFDRMVYHYVIDFIYVRIWPFPFNVADSCITVGAIGLILTSLLSKSKTHASDPV